MLYHPDEIVKIPTLKSKGFPKTTIKSKSKKKRNNKKQERQNRRKGRI